MARETRSVSIRCDDDNFMRGMKVVASKQGKRVGDLVREAVDKYIGNEISAEVSLFFTSDTPRMKQSVVREKSVKESA